MDKLLFALSRTAVKHEMLVCQPHLAATLPIVHHNPPSPHFGAAAFTLASPRAKAGAPFDFPGKQVKTIPSSHGWHFHLIPAYLTAKTSQCRLI
jgi:hypothetical protein